MNGAALAIGVGIWVLAQIFKGQALQRLGVIGPPIGSSSSSAPPSTTYNGPAGGDEGGANA